jgi:hypothetical protein
LSAFLAAALLVLETGPASAAMISLTATTPTGPMTPGSTNNYFDVMLTSDTGVNIWAFMFELTADSMDITLTRVTTTDQPDGSGLELSNYIFKDHSDVTTNWSGVSSWSSGQTINAADAYVDLGEPFYVLLTADEPVALGRVWFDVSAGASPSESAFHFNTHPFATNFTTDLTDPDNPQTTDLETNPPPSITLHILSEPVGVPEPGVPVALSGLVSVLALWQTRRKGRAWPSPRKAEANAWRAR